MSINPIEKVGFLSTYYENIGDDFIRIGTTYLLEELLQKKIEYNHFSKANKLSFYFKKSKLSHSPRWQMGNLARKINDQIYFRIKKTGFGEKMMMKKLASNDLMVIAGTPLFFFTLKKFTFLKNSFWPEMFFSHFNQSLINKSLFAIGIGSIYTEEIGTLAEKYPEEFRFMKEFYISANFCSFRDQRTAKLFKHALGNAVDDVKVLPCPSIFTARYYGIKRQKESDSKIVVLSYSEESASIDEQKEQTIALRRKALKEIVNTLRTKNYELVFFAHNKIDRVLHDSLSKEYPFIKRLSGTGKDLLTTLSSADFLLAWRVHGAMGAASIGCPAILFKTDSRSSTSELFEMNVIDDRKMDVFEINEEVVKMTDKGYRVVEANVKVVDTWERKYLEELKPHIDELN